MQKAENILQAIHKMGEKHIPLTRVYRSLFSEDLYLTAYAKIYKNDGALTPGSGGITADGTRTPSDTNTCKGVLQSCTC